jgi:hypothetical protein
MPASKKLGANKVRPKKLNPGETLLKIGKGFTMGALRSIKKGISGIEITSYSQIMISINGLLKKLSLSPEKFNTLLLDEIFSRDDDDLQSIMSYATTIGIIENRLDECFRFSIASNPLMIEKFFNLNDISQTRILHIQTIINKMLLNFSVPEVDRKSLDSDEKKLLECIVYQFRDPSSVQMGIGRSDIEGRFDFFKEWCSTIFPNIDPDISLRSGSKKKKRKTKRKSKKKSKKKSNRKTKRKSNRKTKKKSNRKTKKRMKKKIMRGGAGDDDDPSLEGSVSLSQTLSSAPPEYLTEIETPGDGEWRMRIEDGEDGEDGSGKFFWWNETNQTKHYLNPKTKTLNASSKSQAEVPAAAEPALELSEPGDGDDVNASSESQAER